MLEKRLKKAQSIDDLLAGQTELDASEYIKGLEKHDWFLVAFPEDDDAEYDFEFRISEDVTYERLVWMLDKFKFSIMNGDI